MIIIVQIAEIKNEWMRQWAKIVLITERGLPPSERLKQQNAYCDINRCSKKLQIALQKSYETVPLYSIKKFYRENVQ